jgi:predicted nucleic acid-binding protein
MIVIADTGPINYLILIQEIQILPVLYGQILVPASVCDELKHPRARMRCARG